MTELTNRQLAIALAIGNLGVIAALAMLWPLLSQIHAIYALAGIALAIGILFGFAVALFVRDDDNPGGGQPDYSTDATAFEPTNARDTITNS